MLVVDAPIPFYQRSETNFPHLSVVFEEKECRGDLDLELHTEFLVLLVAAMTTYGR